MLNGWIKLHRKLLDNGVFFDAELLKVFIWCILKANRKPKEVNGTKLKTGQFITGRISASEELHIKPSTVYNRLQRLQRMGYINVKSTNKFSIISVLKYGQYQVEDKTPNVPYEKRLEQFTEDVWLVFQNSETEYGTNMVSDFISYWTEPNKSKTKMRFEMQRTWDCKRRLATWKRNSKTSTKSTKPNILDTWQEARNIINGQN